MNTDKTQFHELAALPDARIDHVRGNRAERVTLIEYADFESPASAAAFRGLKEICAVLRSDLKIVFRHFPSAEINARAWRLAEAAEAAGAQGFFWQMHDRLFEREKDFDDGDLVETAAAIGLDVNRFLRELSAHVHAPRIWRDVANGKASGVSNAPSFFINNVFYDAAWQVEPLLAALKAARDGQ